MNNFKLMLSIGLFFSGNNAIKASDFWQITKKYVYENSSVLTAALALGATIYWLLPEEETAPRGIKVYNRSRQELAPILAQKGKAAIQNNKEKYRNRPALTFESIMEQEGEEE